MTDDDMEYASYGEVLLDEERVKVKILQWQEGEVDESVPFYMSTQDPLYSSFDTNLCKIDTKEGDVKYLSSLIGDEYKEWHCECPVLISSQTGSGKNTFIEKVLIPYLGAENKRLEQSGDSFRFRVLILSNRIALNFQTKTRLAESTAEKAGMTDEDKTKKVAEKFAKLDTFGNLMVLSYHGFRGKIGKFLSARGMFTHVILDECHFFTSDAMFNPNTELILRTITKRFGNAVRIYMSATMEDSFPYIDLYERSAHQKSGDDREKYERRRDKNLAKQAGMDAETLYYQDHRPIKELRYKRYNLKRDYSYLDIKCYRDDEELADIIKTSSEKWLVFIDDIKRGLNFKSALLHDIEDEVVTLQSDSKRESVFQDILIGAKLPKDKRVLITTSVLDNGVSFNNNGVDISQRLKNVAVEELDRVKCLQMVGRIRPVADEKITLYIKLANKDDVSKRLKSLTKIKKAYDMYYDAKFIVGGDSREMKLYKFYTEYYDRKGWNKNSHADATKLFYRKVNEPGNVEPNEIASNFVELLIKRYTSILDEITKTGSGWKYMEYQFSWFGMKFTEESDCGIQEFYAFLRNMPEKIKQEFRQEFVGQFVSVYEKSFGTPPKLPENGYVMKAVNKVLSQLNAGISIKRSPGKRDWLVAREQKSDI